LTKNDVFQQTKHTFLYQGCNNRPLLFEPPAHEDTVDKAAPLERGKWYTAYLDEVVKLCVDSDNH
jgi:hypothetical protein